MNYCKKNGMQRKHISCQQEVEIDIKRGRKIPERQSKEILEDVVKVLIYVFPNDCFFLNRIETKVETLIQQFLSFVYFKLNDKDFPDDMIILKSANHLLIDIYREIIKRQSH